MAFDDLIFTTRYLFWENYKINKPRTVVLLVHILLKELFESRLSENKLYHSCRLTWWLGKTFQKQNMAPKCLVSFPFLSAFSEVDNQPEQNTLKALWSKLMIVPLLMGVGLIYGCWIKKYPCIEATYIVGHILCYT